jgi:hypothetical protein
MVGGDGVSVHRNLLDLGTRGAADNYNRRIECLGGWLLLRLFGSDLQEGIIMYLIGVIAEFTAHVYLYN